MTIPLPPRPTNTPLQKPTTKQLTMTPNEQKTYISQLLQDETTFPSEVPIKETIGKSMLMCPRTYSDFHKATPLLNYYAKNGCPVNCGPPWNEDKILRLLHKGPHKSSKSKEAIRQLRKETTEKIAQDYARVIRWGDIKNNIPTCLKISPVAMIPHKSKKYRCILDLSFTLHQDGKSFASVNETTTRLAKPEAMAQLGFCLQRIIAIMADNYNPKIPFLFSKLDIKDGFWE